MVFYFNSNLNFIKHYLDENNYCTYIKATVHTYSIKYEDLVIIEAESDVILNDIVLDGEGDD